MCVSEHLQHHQLIASMNPAFFIIYMLILSYLSLQHTNSPLFPHSWQPILVFVWLCNEPDQENDLAKKCLFDLAFFFFSVAFFFFFSQQMCNTAPEVPEVQTEGSKEIWTMKLLLQKMACS